VCTYVFRGATTTMKTSFTISLGRRRRRCEDIKCVVRLTGTQHLIIFNTSPPALPNVSFSCICVYIYLYYYYCCCFCCNDIRRPVVFKTVVPKYDKIFPFTLYHRNKISWKIFFEVLRII